MTKFEQYSYIRKKVRGPQTCSKISLRFLLFFRTSNSKLNNLNFSKNTAKMLRLDRKHLTRKFDKNYLGKWTIEDPKEKLEVKKVNEEKGKGLFAKIPFVRQDFCCFTEVRKLLHTNTTSCVKRAKTIPLLHSKVIICT